MKFVICHDILGRLRIRVLQSGEMSCSEADTIVFDKTGTLTEAKPVVADVISFQGDCRFQHSTDSDIKMSVQFLG